VTWFADKIGIARWTVVRVLRKNDALVKIGGCLYTTRRKLRDLFPEAWNEINDLLAECDNINGRNNNDSANST
jgi:hypothetical protein